MKKLMVLSTQVSRRNSNQLYWLCEQSVHFTAKVSSIMTTTAVVSTPLDVQSMKGLLNHRVNNIITDQAVLVFTCILYLSHTALLYVVVEVVLTCNLQSFTSPTTWEDAKKSFPKDTIQEAVQAFVNTRG